MLIAAITFMVPFKDNVAIACFLLIKYRFESIELLAVVCDFKRSHALHDGCNLQV